MAKRKEIAKNLILQNGLSMANVAEKLGMNSRQAFIHHFQKDDIDLDLFVSIIKIFNKKYSDFEHLLDKDNLPNKVAEPSESYNEVSINKKITDLEKRLDLLQNKNSELMSFCARLIETLKEECHNKDDLIAKLSVQFISLVAANHNAEKLENGNENIQ